MYTIKLNGQTIRSEKIRDWTTDIIVNEVGGIDPETQPATLKMTILNECPFKPAAGDTISVYEGDDLLCTTEVTAAEPDSFGNYAIGETPTPAEMNLNMEDNSLIDSTPSKPNLVLDRYSVIDLGGGLMWIKVKAKDLGNDKEDLAGLRALHLVNAAIPDADFKGQLIVIYIERHIDKPGLTEIALVDAGILTGELALDPARLNPIEETEKASSGDTEEASSGDTEEASSRDTPAIYAGENQITLQDFQSIGNNLVYTQETTSDNEKNPNIYEDCYLQIEEGDTLTPGQATFLAIVHRKKDGGRTMRLDIYCTSGTPSNYAGKTVHLKSLNIIPNK